MKNLLNCIIAIAFIVTVPEISQSQMYWNKAGTFSGNSTSYVRVPNSASINITSSFTFEAWINPILSGAASKGIISKGGTLGTSLRYGLRLSVQGRVIVLTNGAQRLITKASTVIQDSTWTHVCATYNNSTNTFSIYLNGILDTSAVVAGSAPTSNSDSLFIGISGSSTPFNGQLDEVRIWNRDLSSGEVSQFYRTSLGASTGIYSSLVFSMTFQRENNLNPFTFKDMSQFLNHGTGRNVAEMDMSHQPYHTISTNEAISLDGINDYLSGKDDAQSFPSTDFTFECWIFPEDGDLSQIFRKTAGASTAFSVLISGTEINTTLNNISRSAPVTLNLDRWSHIAVVYSSGAGVISVYLNRVLVGNDTIAAGAVTSSTDSIFIGGTPGSGQFFNGYIDELRITGVASTVHGIAAGMYTGVEYQGGADMITSLTVYKFDGNTLDCGIGESPRLSLRNEARFSHPSCIAGVPRSPLIKGEDSSYQGSFYFKTVNIRIPLGMFGTVSNSVSINMDESINDIDIFVHLNHTDLSNIRILLYKPSMSEGVLVFHGNISNSTDQNLSLIFDDDADSTMKTNTYSSHCSPIKPLNSLEALFGGQSTFGEWSLRILSSTPGDSGIFYSWGIRFNNMESPETNLKVFSLQEGFHNPSTNFTVRDTVTAELRSSVSPYTIAGTSRSYSTSTGTLSFSFDEITLGNAYYIVLKHRNSVETWSSVPVSFSDRFDVNYSFQNQITSAFGSNLVLVDASPTRYASYGGDVNQDGTVDATDVSLIDNDAANFIGGYVVTDLTGDDFVDGTDFAIADNNASNFVSVVRP